MSRVYVAGEALIDLMPFGDMRVPIVGGGPANTAKALSRLNVPTSFIGGISSDEYGALITAEMSSVDLSLALTSNLPTAKAIVTLDSSGSANYQFELEGTATFDFRRDLLPINAPDVLHVGSLATVIDPGARALFDWASSLNTIIVFDPNVRPFAIKDHEQYKSAVEKWIRISKIVKLSFEDFKWLGYSDPTNLFELGPEIVVVTNGADGIKGFTKKEVISIKGLKIDVVDTVGAGDTVGAVVVEGIFKYGLRALMTEKIQEVLTRAVTAAALTCTKKGANPPTVAELGKFEYLT